MKDIVKAIDAAQRKGDVMKEQPETRVSVVMVDGRDNNDLVHALSKLATAQTAANAGFVVKISLRNAEEGLR